MFRYDFKSFSHVPTTILPFGCWSDKNLDFLVSRLVRTLPLNQILLLERLDDTVNCSFPIPSVEIISFFVMLGLLLMAFSTARSFSVSFIAPFIAPLLTPLLGSIVFDPL